MAAFVIVEADKCRCWNLRMSSLGRNDIGREQQYFPELFSGKNLTENCSMECFQIAYIFSKVHGSAIFPRTKVSSSWSVSQDRQRGELFEFWTSKFCPFFSLSVLLPPFEPDIFDYKGPYA